MNDIVKHCLVIGVPLIISNVLHMVLVKKKALSSLAIPIARSWFGENKTWRGFVFMTITNAVILFLCDWAFNFEVENPVLLGAVFGLLYLVFELPNSYVKRKIGIGAGDTHKRYKYFFWWLDKSDSTAGLSFTYFLMGRVSITDAVLIYLILCLTHIVTSIILVSVKIKKSF